MYGFGKKSLWFAGIVVVLLTILAFATRSSMQTAGADSGKTVQTRNAQIQELIRMIEER